MTPAETVNPSYRILIVDDNQAIHDDLRKILRWETSGDPQLQQDEALLFDARQIRSPAFELDSAYQGQQGAAMAGQAAAEGRPYAIAFVDIRMPPGWDGVETVLQLWRMCPELQIVICTAYSDYSWTDIIKKLGHSDSLVILKKPFDNIEVIQLAHALTRKWTASREAQVKRHELERMVEKATAELAYHANRDALTDLPNRRLFADRLQQAIAAARRRGEKLGVVYLDLDGFKNVNDTLGHELGDVLLREVVRRMQDCVRQSDTLARMGGDEFTLIATGLTDDELAWNMGQRLLRLFSAPFRLDGKEIMVSASLGISTYPQHGRTVAELLRSADAAMYEAKRQGKGRAVLYTPEIGEAASSRLELENHLRAALENGEFLLHYQPEFELVSRKLVRFEALLRWQHPTLGLILPGRFIPIAEECGVIVPIGNWVLANACRTAKKWCEAGCVNVPVAVNVSAHQFSRPDFIDTVLEILRQAQLDPSLLELELTESLVIRDIGETAPKIARLRQEGVGVAIDDFGTGYSSLSSLQRLPVNAVKIDRSLVQYLESDPKARSIVTGLVTLAHSIGIRVVAEGVENAQQLEALFRSGTDDVQGFLLGRPAPAESHIAHLGQPSEPAGTAAAQESRMELAV